LVLKSIVVIKTLMVVLPRDRFQEEFRRDPTVGPRTLQYPVSMSLSGYATSLFIYFTSVLVSVPDGTEV